MKGSAGTRALGLFLIIAIGLGVLAYSADEPIILEKSSFFDIIRGGEQDTIVIGSALMSQAGGTLQADTAIWIKGERIILKWNVVIHDSLYRLGADRVDYMINSRQAYALGKQVEIYSEKDSVRMVGTDAYLDRDSSLFRMKNRPTMYLNYPDTANFIVVTADLITFDLNSKLGYADGHVIIRQGETESKSGRAILYGKKEVFVLLEEPEARRRKSKITGDTLIFFSENKKLKQIYVLSNGVGEFKEPTKKDTTLYDQSKLTADEIQFNLVAGELNNIIAGGQAYSFYEPGKADSTEIVKNIVSGDSIKIFMKNEDLKMIQVIGGAEGEYYSGSYKSNDSGRYYTEDTVFYRSDSIRYLPTDSTIELINNAEVTDRKVALKAVEIDFNTSRQLVVAYSDTVMHGDSLKEFIPVILNDQDEEMRGTYLEYSLKTEKGMIKHSKSKQEESNYGGSRLYKSEKEVFYVHDGTYSSCDYENPHYHFYSTEMKVINNDRVIARPVVFYIEKLPLLIIPYYVFSLKEGRHSGFLPFQIGSFTAGGRRIENVGYYWAASQYWDIMGSMDYYEDYGFKYNGDFRYNVRYKFNGSVSGSYATDTRTDNNLNEIRNHRWQLRFNHHHEISPTFKIDADGTFISDKNYYTDFSLNEEDRLNRSITSKLNISKRFDWATMNASFSHNEQIDANTRTDIYPTLSISFPARQVFGPAKKDADGRLVTKWYNNVYLNYNTNLRNYSFRGPVDSTETTRKKYLTVNHNSSLSAPFSLFNYLKFNPSLRYQETWYKVFETDQSRDAGIDASTLYRRYAYSAGVSASTDLYGTVYPNVFGLTGLRHVLTPRVSFGWAPEIDRHDEIKSYTGTGGGGAKAASMSFSLQQIFQAKVRAGEEERKLELLTVNSGFSYNFEADERKFSDLRTSATTTILGNLRVSASVVHDLYKPGTNDLSFFSPYLQSFSVNSSFSTSGIFGTVESGREGDSLLFPAKPMAPEESKQNWSLSVTHSYSESGRGSSFTKTHEIRFSIHASLTKNMNVTYSQYYSFNRKKTVSRYLEIYRKLHCFEGKFTWNIDRSPQGFGFKINVIMIPQIKYEKSQTGIRGAFF